MQFNKLLLLVLLGLITLSAQAQTDNEHQPVYTGTVSSVEYVSSLASRPHDLLPPADAPEEMKDKRSIEYENALLLGNDPQTEDDYFVRNRQKAFQSRSATPPTLVYDAYSSSSQPTDPSLAVGPNHVFVVFNTGFTIYDKAGTQLVPQTAPNPAIFPNGGCCDLTVSYDNAADRWVVSFLGNGAQIAVSDGPDPVTAGWYVFTISQIDDYQKLSIWSDGYYLTENSFGTNKVWAIDRTAALNGDPGTQIIGFDLPGLATFGFFSPQVLNVTDSTLPATGGATVVYLQDDAWPGVSADHVKFWSIDVDWVNTANSTISSPTQINTTPFISVFDGGSFSNLDQPGGGADIDALQAIIMNQAQFRKFGSHNSAVFNFVVDTDAGSGELAGVRWMEFRQSADNQPWTLHQEGTYTAPDGRHAWNASLAMDSQGNIGMGYTSMSGPSTPGTVRVSSYYTGRLDSDPLGTMTFAEELIANGNQNIPSLRYGDYSKIDVDPIDNSTFWFINEYMNSGRKGVVGAFQIQSGGSDTTPPTDPTNLMATNITTNSATLNWTASTDDVGVTQYNIFIDGNLVGTSTTTTFQVTGLSPATTYLAEVNAEDAAGNTSGNASTTFTTLVQMGYCASGSQNAGSEYLQKFRLNTINNTSGPSNYTDFTNLSTDLEEGLTYQLRVLPNWPGTVEPVGYAAWIDYNNDEDFDDAGEMVWSQAPTTTSPLSATFTVPAGTAGTATRLRLSMKRDGIPGPCESFADGEVEDYTVVLIGSGPPPPSNQIAAYYFETGLDGWTDGGTNCIWSSNSSVAFEGIGSVALRNGTSTSNAESPVLDLSTYSDVTFEFHFYSRGMDPGDDVIVEFFDGSTYQTIGQYVAGTDFVDDAFFSPPLITLDAATFNFNGNNRFRVSNSANANNDWIAFDQVIITDVSGPLALAGADNNEPSNALMLRNFTEEVAENVQIFPNPANEEITIDMRENNYDEIVIFASNGQIVYTAPADVDKLMIDVSEYAKGMYFVRFVSNGLATTRRFVKQ